MYAAQMQLNKTKCVSKVYCSTNNITFHCYCHYSCPHCWSWLHETMTTYYNHAPVQSHELIWSAWYDTNHCDKWMQVLTSIASCGMLNWF